MKSQNPLTEYVESIPAVLSVISNGVFEDGNWWIKFQIDIDHPLAWQTVQELGHVLNYAFLESPLPTMFIPVSPPPYMNGGPTTHLYWAVESKSPDFTPEMCLEWLKSRLPNPIDDPKQWIVDEDEFDESWLFLTDTLFGGPADELQQSMMSRYQEPARYYHNLQHLKECLQHFATYSHLATNADEVELALWFHDAIYDPHAKDNEEQSALLAVSELTKLNLSPDKINRIRDLILITKHTAQPQTADEALIIDIDLAILGASEERYNEYEVQIRQEYAFVEEPVFKSARKAILESFLNRETIYTTEEIRSRLEDQARVNLERAIKALE